MRSLAFSIVATFHIVALSSCGGNGWRSDPISTDSASLGTILNLNNFRPASVRYQFWYTDHSPAPSDYVLQAVLYYHDTTFSRLRDENLKLKPITRELEHNFNFEWLDKNILSELEARDSLQREFPPDYFEKGALTLGGYVMLKNKVVLMLSSSTTGCRSAPGTLPSASSPHQDQP